MLQHVGIHESSGYLRKCHWCKSQRIFTQVQFVIKFCSGRRLVMSQEFTKVVDVYKKQWIFNVIPIGHVPHVNTHTGFHPVGGTREASPPKNLTLIKLSIKISQ